MGLPRGIPKKTKTSLKGDLAHPVPPPSLPGQGRERRKRKRAERRRGARGGPLGSKKMAIEVQVRWKVARHWPLFSPPIARKGCDAGVPPGRQAVRRDEF
jgi:hypothetical protein